MDRTLQLGGAVRLSTDACRMLMFSVAVAVFATLFAAAPGLAQQTDSYKVGPKDVLSVSVFNHPELTRKVTVGGDGTISFPLLGSFAAVDRTTSEIASDIATKLSDGFLRNPQVTVEVAEYVSRRIFVIGEVRTPGPLTLNGATTLLEALARAGSLTEQAGGEVLLLRPPTQGGGPTVPGQAGVSELSRVSVQQLRSGNLPANVPLQDGDTIFVPRAELIHVLGNVKTPGAYRFEPGLTAIRAIYLAGGVSEMGSTGRITITRTVDGKETKLKAKEDDPIKPGDTLIVGTRRF
jgi:polysaccharide biosynthesis/export protein